MSAAPRARFRPQADPDVLIVGAGAAGCVLAARLSEDPACEVLLLEAGPDLRSRMPPEVRSGWRLTRKFDWGYASEPDEYGVVRELPRGRLVGGCSSTNATFALRGSPADYDAWARAGNQGWSFEELLPYFLRLERDEDFGDRPWHGNAGPLPIRRYRADELTDVAAATLEAFDSLGIPRVEDHNAPGAVGAGPVPVNCRDGVRMSTALTYLPPRERDNLTVRCEAEVARLVLDGTRAVGVQLTSGQELRSRRVALCAGAYGSPALLLRSGVGPADELAKLGVPAKLDLPGVGCNLIDHPSVSVTIPYRSTPDPAPLLQVVATLRSDGSSPHDPPDLQLLTAGPYPAEGDERPWFMSAAALLKPRSRGQLSLRSADPAEPPRIRLGYLTEQTDVDRLAQGLERAEELASHPAFRALGAADGTTAGDSPLPAADERRDWLRRSCWTYHHAVGTCAMGAGSDPAAVVDARGRVHGSEGLYVVDASVMPDVPSANTHIPTVMAAERLAEMLAAELR